MQLEVHIDLRTDVNNALDSVKSVDFAKAGHPASTMLIFADGSMHGNKIGWAAVWKDPAARVAEHWANDHSSLTIEGQTLPHHLSNEAELRAIATGLTNALLWRPDGVDTVVVLSDSRATLELAASWEQSRDPAAAHRFEPTLVRVKYLAARLRESGVAVTLRWLKSRAGVDGHDIADVWARIACGAGPDISGQYYLRHHEVRQLVADQTRWERENRDQRIEDELAALEREVL